MREALLVAGELAHGRVDQEVTAEDREAEDAEGRAVCVPEGYGALHPAEQADGVGELERHREDVGPEHGAEALRLMRALATLHDHQGGDDQRDDERLREEAVDASEHGTSLMRSDR